MKNKEMRARHKIEEDLRARAYANLDTMALFGLDAEYRLWVGVHEALEKLAVFYDKHGLPVWKH